MSSEMIIGLRIFAIGFSVTFLALGLLSLIMRWLPRFFPNETKPHQPIETVPTVIDEEQRLEEMAVALAVGISLLERTGSFDQRDPTLGDLLSDY